MQWTANVIRDEELGNQIKNQIIDQYPNGETAANQKFEDFRKIEDVDEAVKLIPELQSIVNENENYMGQFRYAMDVLISRFAKKKDYKSIEKYISKIKSNSNKASIYNLSLIHISEPTRPY